MHNVGFEKMFFITQFTRSLRSNILELCNPISLKPWNKLFILPKSKRPCWPRVNTEPPNFLPSDGSFKLVYRGSQNLLDFYCVEPFDANHVPKCTKRPQPALNAVVVNDLDVPLTNEVFHELDLEDSITSEFCQLSLNALAGTDKGGPLNLRALVKNKVMLNLMDSDNSHSFVSSSFLPTCGI